MVHFSLRQLIVWFALAAVVIRVGVFLGIASLFWPWAVLSLTVTFIFVRLAKSERYYRWTLITPAYLVVCCLAPVISIASAVHAALLLVAALAACIIPRVVRPRAVKIGWCCWTAAAIAGLIPGYLNVTSLRDLRRQYAFESVAGRLDYESRGQPQTKRNAAQAANDLAVSQGAPAITAQYASVAKASREYYFGRRHNLKRLHSRTYQSFVHSSGFGVGRMMYVIPGRLDYPPLQDLPFQPSDAEAPGQTDDDLFDGGLRESYYRSVEFFAPAPKTYLHAKAYFDFLEPAAFGYYDPEKSQVAGFVPHAFHQRLQVDTYRLERLELVSLLRFKQPRVYVLDHLPRMDQLRADTVETRPLDEFERTALRELSRADNAETIIAEHDGHVRMLGAIRATTVCLDCHNVAPLELLGAFSYRLTHAPTSQRPASLSDTDRESSDGSDPLRPRPDPTPPSPNR